MGGGGIIQGKINYTIDRCINLTGFEFVKIFFDARNRLEKLISRRTLTAQYYFPYGLYVFRKVNK